MTVQAYVLLRKAQWRALSYADLERDKVQSGHELGNGVLDLEARIHLEKVEFASLIEQELNGPCAAVVNVACSGDCRRTHSLTQFWCHYGARRLLYDLLVPPLYRAVALTEMHGISVRISKDLDLDMAGSQDRALKNQFIRSKGVLGFL